MDYKIKITFTNLIGAIATFIGMVFMAFRVPGSEMVTMAALGLVATKKVNDMVKRDGQ